MIYSIFADYNTTLYEISSSINTGLDQILEVEKVIKPTTSESFNSRPLIKFDLSSVSQSIVDGLITSPSFSLKLFATDNQEQIPAEYSLNIYPVSESWNRGIGRRFNKPSVKEGASWKYRDGEEAGTEWTTGSFSAYSTGSYSVNKGGGTWYTSSAASQSYSYQAADVDTDVTSIVDSWLGGTNINNGFIVKRADTDEKSLVELGNLKFFSAETHTVYQPKLEVKWDDSSFSTGSLSALTDEEITVYFKNLKSEYKPGEKAKVRVRGRATYPTKTYSTSSAYLDNKYLPTSSYYSLRDAYTEEVIVPFSDNHTKISCDTSGNYFNIWMDGLHPERFYRFVIKVKRSSTDIQIFDNDYIFKLVR